MRLSFQETPATHCGSRRRGGSGRGSPLQGRGSQRRSSRSHHQIFFESLHPRPLLPPSRHGPRELDSQPSISDHRFGQCCIPAENHNIALVAARAASEENQGRERCVAHPCQPRNHPTERPSTLSRSACKREKEVARERWSLSLQFSFISQIPPDLMIHNPMGIVITYLQADRALVSE